MNSTKRLLLVSFSFFLGLSPAAPGRAESYSLWVDLQPGAGTGCSVTLPQNGTLAAVDHRISLTADGVNVLGAEIATCDPGTGLFGPASPLAGSFPYAVGNGGVSNGAVVEAQVALASLGAAPDATLGVYFTAAAADGLEDLLSGGTAGAPMPFLVGGAPGAVAIPVLNTWGILLLMSLLAILGLGLLARRRRGAATLTVLVLLVPAALLFAGSTFVADGNLGDWSGVAPLGSDGVLDNLAAEQGITDLVAGFAVLDGGELCFRFDTRFNFILQEPFDAVGGWVLAARATPLDPLDGDSATSEIAGGRLLVSASQDCGSASASADLSLPVEAASMVPPVTLEAEILRLDNFTAGESGLRLRLGPLELLLDGLFAVQPGGHYEPGLLVFRVDEAGNISLTLGGVELDTNYYDVDLASPSGASLRIFAFGRGADCFHYGLVELDSILVY